MATRRRRGAGPARPGDPRGRGRHARCSRTGRDALHYRDWYDLLDRDRARVAGKDPLAVFLTQISRSPARAARARSPGTTSSTASAARLVTRRPRRAACTATYDAHRPDPRTRRTQLTAEIASTEKALEEVITGPAADQRRHSRMAMLEHPPAEPRTRRPSPRSTTTGSRSARPRSRRARAAPNEIVGLARGAAAVPRRRPTRTDDPRLRPRLAPTPTREAYAGVGEHAVYVAPEARGRGVGAQLLHALAEAAEARRLLQAHQPRLHDQRGQPARCTARRASPRSASSAATGGSTASGRTRSWSNDCWATPHAEIARIGSAQWLVTARRASPPGPARAVRASRAGCCSRSSLQVALALRRHRLRATS